MTPKELMRVIVRTEQSARDAYEEALRKQADFAPELEAEKQRLREEIFDRAQAETARAQAAAAAKADAEIRRLDRQLALELEQARAMFEDNEQTLTDKIFRIVVGLDG